MTFKTIVANFSIDGSDFSIMNFAADVAKRFDAHLIGTTAADLTPALTLPNRLAFDQDYLERGQHAEECMQKMHDKFHILADAVSSRQWRHTIGNPTRFLEAMARCADLVILSADEHAIDGQPDRCVNVGDIVLNAGRPVLFATKRAKRIFTSIALVAWKDTREARRAVANSLPILQRATDVIILTVNQNADDRTYESIEDVEAYLRRHGVRSRGEVIRDRREAESILAFAHSIEAELVVSGAYGHSRTRQRFFGGVTRSLLLESGFSRLMSG